MYKFKAVLKYIGFTLGTVILVLIALSIIFYLNALPHRNPSWGVNFATGQTRFLGFEPSELMGRIINELNPEYIRITAYWEEMEPAQGQFDFSVTDSLLDLTDNSNSKVVLVLGHKQPRWPECHHPDWWENLDADAQTLALHNMLSKSITHFKDRPSIWAWQIENEPFFDFGKDCPVSKISDYKAEVTIVKAMDDRPIIITDSGEKGSWLPAAWAGADYLGATMYREVYHGEKGKYLTYPLPAFTYAIKAGAIKLLSPTNQTLGMELQAEPWFNRDPHDTPFEEQKQHMNPDIFAENIEYARQAGLAQNYFWGTEWWFWLAENGDSSMLDEAKEILKER